MTRRRWVMRRRLRDTARFGDVAANGDTAAVGDVALFGDAALSSYYCWGKPYYYVIERSVIELYPLTCYAEFYHNLRIIPKHARDDPALP